MCSNCKLVSLIADDRYRCHNCGYEGRTDPNKPGHCPECGHDMRDEPEIIPANMRHG